MQYELINPSDPYTFIAENNEVATLTVFSLGIAYGAQNQEGETVTPVFLFSSRDNAANWYKDTFKRTTDEGLEANLNAVADALDSMMLGNFEDRKRYQTALEYIDDEEKREKFKAEWQDARSSMNDIGTYAHNLAKKLKEKAKNER